MTKKNVDKLSDQSHISEEAKRAYKNEPAPAEPPAAAPLPPDTTVPVSQADGAGMKAMDEKTVDDAAKEDAPNE
jgi:hypothetical protein